MNNLIPTNLLRNTTKLAAKVILVSSAKLFNITQDTISSGTGQNIPHSTSDILKYQSTSLTI